MEVHKKLGSCFNTENGRIYKRFCNKNRIRNIKVCKMKIVPILSHIFAFEVEDNIIKTSVKKLINKPLGYFDDKESGRIRNVIVSGASETHSFLAYQLCRTGNP